MKEKEELSPAWKALIVNAIGICLLAGLATTYCWLPLGSFAFGALSRIWRGFFAATTFGLVELDFILIFDWVTPGDYFVFNSDIAKAIILSACIVGMVAVYLGG